MSVVNVTCKKCGKRSSMTEERAKEFGNNYFCKDCKPRLGAVEKQGEKTKKGGVWVCLDGKCRLQ